MDHPDSPLPPGLRTRARGALDNASGRYEAHQRTGFQDGWDIPEEERLLRTEVRCERPRSALVRNTSPDLPFDRSVSPYRGCEHGCIYCYARPSHAWLGLSPGLDFETRLIARPGLAEVLARELSARRYRPAPLAIGTNTDPYQPIEAEYRIMRAVLEVLQTFRHPVTIVTKGTLIERDLDILGEMGRAQLAQVGISLTTLDPAIARRLEVIRRLVAAGCPVRVMVSPIVPGLTDPEIEAIVKAGAEAGATAASWIMLRLPLEVAGLFRAWVAAHFPERAEKIMARVRDVRGGRDYDPDWRRRMCGEGVWSDLVARRFRAACARHGLDAKAPPLRCDLFRVPPRPGDQLSLFPVADT